MLNPLWLNTFKTLIDIGHFTQAAEKLYMTQPGVSQHIKKLELACGYSLIKRDKKSFELTEQGRMVYQYAIKAANNEAELMESLSFDDPFSGQCSLSCSGSLALLLYPSLLSLQQQYLHLTIQLEAAPNHKILNDVITGDVDLGIVTHLPNSSHYQSSIIGVEPLCLILPKRYEGKAITTSLLKECGLLHHPDAHHYLSLYFDLCNIEELKNINIDELPKAGYINQIAQILLPISKGIGFTVLPKSALESGVDRSQLYILEGGDEVKETLYLINKRNRDLPLRYTTIITTLRNQLNN